jgi:hypothetical protein
VTTGFLEKDVARTTQAKLLLFVVAALGAAVAAQCQTTGSCAALTNLKLDGVEITNAAIKPAGAAAVPRCSQPRALARALPCGWRDPSP